MHGNLSLAMVFAHKSYKYHEYLSLRDGFISHRLHRFYRYAIFARYSRRTRTLRCSRFCCSLFFFRSFFLTELTEFTEFFYSRTRCLTSSNALDGTHGNAVAAPASHSELVSPTDYTDLKDFLFLLYDSLFCFAKIALRICTDFFGLATERTHEPCVPTRGYCVCEYFFVIL